MQNRFKPILPAPTAPKLPEGDTPPTIAPSPIPGLTATLRQRRSAVRVACNGCRAKRSACDGKRPTCSQCLKRGSMPCVYVSSSPTETATMARKREMEALKKELDSLSETLEILRTLPEDMSFAMLRRMRAISTTDSAGLLALARGETPPDDALPRQGMARPPPQDSYEFDLMLRHAVAYPALAPLDAGAVSLTTYVNSANATPPPCPGPEPATDPVQTSMPSSQSPQASRPSLSFQPPSSMPLEAASHSATPILELCDGRLNRLQIGFWIGADVADSVAASMISLYLETDHPILGLFDVDLFLDDLIARRTSYCSPLLVCSVLLWACHAYNALVPSSDSVLDELLLTEALALWDHAQGVDSLPTVAAAQLLSLDHIYKGENAGQPFFDASIAMAQRMGLFGEQREILTVSLGHESEADHADWVQAAGHTAWGVYGCLALHSWEFQLWEPALGFPPLLDVPGAFSNRDVDEQLTDGEVAPRLPTYMGRTFPAICSFWVITGEWMLQYYTPDQTPVFGRIPWSFAENIFEKLLAWSDHLHFRLARGDQATHHVTMLHIWFHASILELFRPFAQSTSSPMQEALEWADPAKAQAVFTASLNQLKHMVIVFRYTYPCARYVVFWHVALLHIANAVLEDTTDPQWRVYFAFCINCYADIFSSFRVAEGIVRGLLSIGLRSGVIPGSEARASLRRVHSRSTYHNYATKAPLVVDLKLASTDREAAQLKAMAGVFDALSLFDEVIDSEVVDGE